MRKIVLFLLVFLFQTTAFASNNDMIYNQAVRMFSEAMMSVNSRNFAQGLSYLNNPYVIQYFGNTKDYWLARGLSNFETKRYGQSISDLLKARQLGLSNNNEDYSVLYHVGVAYKLLGEQNKNVVQYDKQAYSYLLEACNKYPNQLEAFADLSDVCVVLENHACVINTTTKILERNPKISADAWKRVASAFLKLDDVDGALNTWEEGLKYFPTDLEMLYCYCDTLLSVNPMMYNSQIINEYAGRMYQIAPRHELTQEILSKIQMCAMQDPANPMSPMFQMEEEMRQQQMREAMPDASAMQGPMVNPIMGM